MVGEWNGVVSTVVERTVLDGLPLRRRMRMTAVDRCRKRECVHVRVRDECARVVDTGVCVGVCGGEGGGGRGEGGRGGGVLSLRPSMRYGGFASRALQ